MLYSSSKCPPGNPADTLAVHSFSPLSVRRSSYPSCARSIEGFAAIPEEFACGNKRKLGSEGERRDNKRHKGGRGRGRGRGRGGRGGRGSKKVVEL